VQGREDCKKAKQQYVQGSHDEAELDKKEELWLTDDGWKDVQICVIWCLAPVFGEERSYEEDRERGRMRLSRTRAGQIVNSDC
jgi:hypothetical protein